MRSSSITLLQKKRILLLCIFGFILILATVLRFIRYNDRWGLGYDQLAFAITGRYAIDTFKLPLLGPFSSAGPFQTGGEWYWLVMIGTLLFYPIVQAPWIFMGILSVLTVMVMMAIGKQLGGTLFACITGACTAVSTAQITQSTNLANQTPIALPAALAILFGLLYIQKRQLRYLFCVGLSIGIASSIHLQGLGLFPILVFALLFAGLPSILSFVVSIIGLGIPWIPVFLSDSQNHWVNTKNMIYYYRFDQYRVSLDVLGRNWKNFLGQFIPHITGFTIGGTDTVGYFLLGLILLTALLLLYKRKLTKPWAFLSVSFLGMITIARYTHAPLFESFVVYLHPIILLLVSGTIVYWIRKQKLIGIPLFALILFFSLTADWKDIKNATNLSGQEMLRLESAIQTAYPSDNISIYHSGMTKTHGLLLLLPLDIHRRLQTNGKKIGITITHEPTNAIYTVFYRDQKAVISLVDLSVFPGVLDTQKWSLLTAEDVYNDTQKWFKQ